MSKNDWAIAILSCGTGLMSGVCVAMIAAMIIAILLTDFAFIGWVILGSWAIILPFHYFDWPLSAPVEDAVLDQTNDPKWLNKAVTSSFALGFTLTFVTTGMWLEIF